MGLRDSSRRWAGRAARAEANPIWRFFHQASSVATGVLVSAAVTAGGYYGPAAIRLVADAVETVREMDQRQREQVVPAIRELRADVEDMRAANAARDLEIRGLLERETLRERLRERWRRPDGP
jgi:hypothetical protein